LAVLEVQRMDQHPIRLERTDPHQVVDVATARRLLEFLDGQPGGAGGAVVRDLEVVAPRELYAVTDDLVGRRVVEHPVRAGLDGETHVDETVGTIPALYDLI